MSSFVATVAGEKPLPARTLSHTPLPTSAIYKMPTRYCKKSLLQSVERSFLQAAIELARIMNRPTPVLNMLWYRLAVMNAVRCGPSLIDKPLLSHTLSDRCFFILLLGSLLFIGSRARTSTCARYDTCRRWTHLPAD